MWIAKDPWTFFFCTCTILFVTIVTCAGTVQIDNTDGTNGTLLQITEGDNVFLQCRATGFTSNHVIIWNFNDQMITNAGIIIDNRFINRGDRFKLHYDTDMKSSVGYSYIQWLDISRFESGTYSCGVYQVNQNADDMILTRKIFVVDVLYLPSDNYPRCTPDGEIYVDIGQPLALSCLSEEGNPRVNLTWERGFEGDFRHLQGITSERAGFVISELNYIAVDLSLQNALFVCAIKTSSVSQLSQSCSVRTHVVIPEPLVYISPQVAFLSTGDSIEFTCSSYLTMADIRWSTQPAIPAGRTNVMSNDTRVFTISSVKAHDNGTIVDCTVFVENNWIRATSTLLVLNRDSFSPTTMATMSDKASSTIWMVACIVMSIVAVVGLISCFVFIVLSRRKRPLTMKVLNRKGQTVTVPAAAPYCSRSNGLVSHHAEETMGPEAYMTYHRPEPEITADETQQQQQPQHRPLQRITAGIPKTAVPFTPPSVDDNLADDSVAEKTKRMSEMDNPEYMTVGMYTGVSDKPVEIRNLPNVGRNSTMEPDYMPVKL